MPDKASLSRVLQIRHLMMYAVFSFKTVTLIREGHPVNGNRKRFRCTVASDVYQITGPLATKQETQEHLDIVKY